MDSKTCGVFVVSADGRLLIGHPTGMPNHGNVWSIPKGLPDADESNVQAAARELMEESGIVVDPSQLTELMSVKYKSGKKTLHAFWMLSDKNYEDISVHCDSMVEIPGRDPFPEIDRFEWVRMDMAVVMLHEAQSQCIGLLVNILRDLGKY